MSRTFVLRFVELSRESVEQIAARTAELLVEQPTSRAPRALDAAEVARRLGRSRSWVYEHADELGATRPIRGTRPRLLFDPARIEALVSGEVAEQGAQQATRQGRRSRPSVSRRHADLLPIRNGVPRGRG